MYYSAIGILAALILIIENQDVMRNSHGAFSRPAWVVYRKFLVTVFIYYITDILWGILENLELALPLFIDTSVYFAAMAFGTLAWTHYTVVYLEGENKPFGKIFILFGKIFAALVSALVILNIFVPVMFTVGAGGEYSELWGRNAVLIVQVVLLLMISVYAFSGILRKGADKRHKYRTLSLFGLIMAVFLFAQLWFPLLPLYGIAYLLGTCLLHSFVVGDEKEQFRRELEQSRKINSLRQSVSSLFNNMPAISYSKDAETGVYLACNQAFVEYAGKSSPEEVNGLRDDELFDSQTAQNFKENDRKVTVTGKAYLFYEDVKDPEGNSREFETTKLRYIDEDGKLCLLGMSLDITEIKRMKRENKMAKEAYEEVLSASATYESIVDALSKEYFNLYYVDVQTDDYIEYGSKTRSDSTVKERRGKNFFESAKTDAVKLVFEEDREALLTGLKKDALLKEISESGIFVSYYRLMINDKPSYVSLKATRIAGDDKHIIIGITNIDNQMRDHIIAEHAREEKKAYVRLNAFNRNLIVLYVVEPGSGQYTEFNSTKDFNSLGIEKRGSEFFETALKNSFDVIYPEDLEYFRTNFNKQNILDTIALDGLFVLDYRLVIDGKPVFVRLKAAEVEEDDKTKLVIGLENIDARVRRDQKQEHELSVARKQAATDALTGVKNKFVFDNMKKELNSQLENELSEEYAIVVCDINDLKLINDRYGHKRGDEYIREACSTICDIFRHSPVFRIGGDEFAVICKGHDYDEIDNLLGQMNEVNTKNAEKNKVQIAFGMSKSEANATAEEVFEKADKLMYKCKAALKSAEQ